MKPYIYTADIREMSREDFCTAYFSMSAERREKCRAYKRESDRKLCIAADFLIRKALAERTGMSAESFVFSASGSGKPFCVNCPLPFSISHSGTVAAAAVGGKTAVGVDIERIRPVKQGILHYFCSGADLEYTGVKPREKREITDRETLERIFCVWTFKEAYSKCEGTGINEKITEISLENAGCNFYLADGYCLCTVEK